MLVVEFSILLYPAGVLEENIVTFPPDLRIEAINDIIPIRLFILKTPPAPELSFISVINNYSIA